MLREIIKFINYLCECDLLRTKTGRAFVFFSVIFGGFIYMSVNNTLALSSLLKNDDDQCIIINNTESKHLAKLASLCNNSESNQCFVSRWCIQDQREDNNRLKAKIYQLIACSLNKGGEVCSSIVMQSKYERPLYIDINLLNQNAMLDNNATCGYITREEIERNRYQEFLDYSSMLAIKPDLFTYCLDGTKMTLLIQRAGHDSKKSDKDKYAGCMDGHCIIEVIGLHAKLKNKFKKNNF